MPMNVVLCCLSLKTGNPREAISDDLSLDSEWPLRLARQPPATVHFHHLTAVDGSLAREQVFLQVIDLTDGNETPGNQLQFWTGWLLTTTVDNTNQDWIVTDIF
ncbi:hypothetical protein B0H13DRAFT_1902944 [Mycena leptocephala]|nr:hypothetical protein B0H13DRAFT_1902944 [Mycena leptocephala]